jgi:hypothetical protein
MLRKPGEQKTTVVSASVVLAVGLENDGFLVPTEQYPFQATGGK